MIDAKKKIAGVLIPVFALRRDGDLGIGDTLALKQAIEFCARNSLTVLQVLPINETGGDNSPYGAISSVALDPLLLTVDPDSIPGLNSDDYERIVAASGIRNKDQAFVHYDITRRLKLDLLRAAWNKFKVNPEKDFPEDLAAFKLFEEHHSSWLPYYSLFRTFIDLHHGDPRWTMWPPEHQTFEQAEEWLAGCELKESLEDTRKFYCFVQWIAFRQWLNLRLHADKHHVSLMGDIPFGVSRYSCDVWAERKLFDLNWSGGAPPETHFQGDPFTARWGQNWGIPLYRWTAHDKQHYRWWRQRIGRLTDVFHYFRIDHVLGFFRIYAFPWIPERNDEFVNLTEEEAAKMTKDHLPHFIPHNDYPAKLGRKNAAEGEAILRVILRAAGENDLVAEDLGAVPPYVRPLLRRMGIPGFAIPIFERHEETREFKKKEELHPLNMATYGTHDHMPLAMFYEDLSRRWHGPEGHEAWLDVQRLMRFLELDEKDPPAKFTDELHESFVENLLATPCWLAMYMIPDILGTKEQFNAPGVGTGNWTRRLSMTLEAYENDRVFGKKIKRLSSLIQKSGRLPTTTH